MATDRKEYPQFSENPAESTITGVSAGFDRFRFSPALHHRPGTLLQTAVTDHGVGFVFKAAARQSVLSYTHETALHLYKPAEPELEKVYLHIELWTDRIFRILCSTQPQLLDPFTGLPKDMQMLIASPEKVDFEYENGIIKTSEIEIQIDSETGQIRAQYPDGTEFFTELKTTFKAADIYDLSISKSGTDSACFEAIELENDELIYGLGERFDSLTRNGREVDFHNKDAVGTTSQRTYVNIPFYMSTKGYGLFLNSSAKTDWQIATRDSGAVQFAVLDSQLDYFVIAGRTPKEILNGYCHLTGFSKLPPLWSFGLWMSRNSYTSWDIVDEIARDVRANDIPCDVLHLDTAWFQQDWNCDLKFSEERFPSPKEHMAELKERGFHVSLWQYNFIPPRENNTHYHEAVANGYLAKDQDGRPYQLPESCKGSWTDDVIIDFSNPDAGPGTLKRSEV